MKFLIRSGSLLSLVLLSASLFAQTTGGAPGLIDGSVTPNLIPDSVAFRLVFLSLRVSPGATSQEIARQSALLKHIGLPPGDILVAQTALRQFDSAYGTWEKSIAATGPSADRASADAAVSAIVQQTLGSLMQQLSPSGAAKLAQYVQAAKVRMKVRT